MDEYLAILQNLNHYIYMIDYLGGRVIHWHHRLLQGHKAAWDLKEYCATERLHTIYSLMEYIEILEQS